MRIHRITGFTSISLVLLFALSAFAHVRVSPSESSAGATQKYTMSVPTEKQSPTVRIEVTFPASVTVTSLGVTQGWTAQERKDDAGKIIGKPADVHTKEQDARPVFVPGNCIELCKIFIVALRHCLFKVILQPLRKYHKLIVIRWCYGTVITGIGGRGKVLFLRPF